MSISKFCTALGSIHNENTLALANINFDFALFKYDAPKEFSGLGSSLSEQRRIAAESGTPHRMARKLGALFEQLLPSTPELIAAYGYRVSEISQMQTVNPKGQDKDGPFSDRVGADGTAIWAAATSGPSAMPVLMLACMLARIWSGPEATSLWTEIISQRQEEIRNTCDGSKASDYASLQAMQQEFSRAQLADWDASIRAWLRTADEAKMRDQRQLLLIVNNVNLPVNTNMSVYKSVVDAWKTAMSSMNDLIKGVPQGVHSGALLLGLSAWHLYPDMVVQGTKEIKFQDPLVGLGGILTIGLQNTEQHGEGVYWSLPLAHLRYYGHPVKSSRSISQDVSRVSSDQLVQVALGAVLSGWGEPPTELEILNQIQWFSDLHGFLCRAASRHDKNVVAKGQMSQNRVNPAMVLLNHFGWVSMFMNSVNQVLSSEGTEREMSLRLIAFGQRRCGNFLAKPGSHPPPFFGLSDPGHILPLLNDEELRIELLRKVAMGLDLDKDSLIIRYRSREDPITGLHEYEYASAAPCLLRSSKRDSSGAFRSRRSHKRWISMEREVENMQLRPPHFACNCVERCGIDRNRAQNEADLIRMSKIPPCPCIVYLQGCTENCSCNGLIGEEDNYKCHTNASRLQRRVAIEKKTEELQATNECVRTHFLSEFANGITLNLPQQPAPSEHTRRVLPSSATRESNVEIFQDTWERNQISRLVIALKDPPWENNTDESIKACEMEYYFGDENAAILRLRNYEATNIVPTELLSRQDFTEMFSADGISATRLHQYLQTDFGDYTTSLEALASAFDVYKLLPNATIDLRVTSRLLASSSWASWMADSVAYRTSKFRNTFSRAQTFACLAHLESGSFDIDPRLLKEVIAMSSGNSIFVAAPLLCDPSESPGAYEVSRVVGNIGRAGIAMLIPPQEVKSREIVPETWNLINHAPFDGELIDSFENTSLHLSFTPYTMPINVGEHGMQDKEAFFLESVVSVYDQDKWVADLDILKIVQSRLFSRRGKDPECAHIIDEDTYEYEEIVSFDSWNELLDKENMSGVVRARGNWLARLATAAVNVQQGSKTVVLSHPVCWDCVELKSGNETTYIC